MVASIASHSGSLPYVTIAIPCLNEIAYIEQCLDDALGQDYPADRIEVIVADGGSADGTRGVLERQAGQVQRLSWLENPDRYQSAGLNAVIRAANGDVIVRFDVHCRYPKDYVRHCVEVMVRTGAMNVGGAQRTVARTRFQCALRTALNSPLGIGGARYKRQGHEGYVDTVFLGAFDRHVFEVVGLYDPHAATNEDAELNQRIVESGGRIYLSGEIVTEYFPRDSLLALIRQYFRYGAGRARTLLKRRRLPRLSPAVPFLATLFGLLLLLFEPKAPLTWILFSIYAAVTLAEAIRHCARESWALIPIVWIIFPTLHLSHGLGFAYGLARYLWAPNWPLEPERLAPREVHR